MPRQPKPWYRVEDRSWYTTINREQHRLGEQPPGAEPEKGDAGWNPPKGIQQAFHQLMSDKLSEREKLAVEAGGATKTRMAVIINAFLEHSQAHNVKETYGWHRQFLRAFAVFVGKLRFCDLTPYHFNRWVETKKSWKEGGRRGAVNVTKACLNWWCNQHNIPSHPLQRLKPPPDRAREGIITTEDQQKVLDFLPITDPFRLFFFALQQSGCRPSEVRRVKPEHFDPVKGLWKMPGKTTRKTGKDRVVFLTPALVDLCKALAAHNKDGRALFRNRKNQPWGRQGIDYRFQKLAKDLNMPGLASYTLRRSFVTLGLERGVPIAQMATLCGHADTKMIMKHYSKLTEQTEHMRSMATKASGDAEGQRP